MGQVLQVQQANPLFDQAKAELRRLRYERRFVRKHYKRMKQLLDTEKKYNQIKGWRNMVTLDEYEGAAFDEITNGK